MKFFEVRKTILPTGDFSRRMVKAHTPIEAIALADERGGAGLSVTSTDWDRNATATGRNLYYGAELKIAPVSYGNALPVKEVAA